jgi:cephalosporin hydroxylase
MNFELERAKLILRQAGSGGALRKGRNFLRLIRLLRHDPGLQQGDIGRLMNFIFKENGEVISCLQVFSEIEQLLQLLKSVKPRVVLEIGTNRGGNLFLLTRTAAPDALIVSVDLPGGEFGGGYPLWRVPLYRNFAMQNQHVELVRGNSHSPETLCRAERKLDGRKVDFLFIDGDHTYEGVKQDYEMFSPLVREGGMIGLHDILPAPGFPTCHVDKFWNELKNSHSNYLEFIHDRNQGWAGIGIVTKR